MYFLVFGVGIFENVGVLFILVFYEGQLTGGWVSCDCYNVVFIKIPVRVLLVQ